MALPVSPAAIGGMAQLLIGGGLAVYGLTNSIFNVEGGHRAIVFNRLMGIKEEVRNLPTIVKNLLRDP
jgi:prohibitin 2